jgi:hypothetical protein
MRSLSIAALVVLLSLSSSAMAKHRKAVIYPRHQGYGFVAPYPTPYLAPDAAAMAYQQRFWPNTPLCDEGGYRIRPCSMAPGGGGFSR